MNEHEEEIKSTDPGVTPPDMPGNPDVAPDPAPETSTGKTSGKRSKSAVPKTGAEEGQEEESKEVEKVKVDTIASMRPNRLDIAAKCLGALLGLPRYADVPSDYRLAHEVVTLAYVLADALIQQSDS